MQVFVKLEKDFNDFTSIIRVWHRQSIVVLTIDRILKCKMQLSELSSRVVYL